MLISDNNSKRIHKNTQGLTPTLTVAACVNMCKQSLS